MYVGIFANFVDVPWLSGVMRDVVSLVCFDR